jgi:hypothetical protein
MSKAAKKSKPPVTLNCRCIIKPDIAAAVEAANKRIERLQKNPEKHPRLPAVAATEQRFDSEKVAISAGQRVNLEFLPSMVVAHDATSSPTPSNPLGTTLYSFFYHSGITAATAMESGQVSPTMYFLLLAIRPVKGNLKNRKLTEQQSQCCYCGKAWPVGKQLTIKEHDDHLAKHGLVPPNA